MDVAVGNCGNVGTVVSQNEALLRKQLRRLSFANIVKGMHDVDAALSVELEELRVKKKAVERLLAFYQQGLPNHVLAHLDLTHQLENRSRSWQSLKLCNKDRKSVNHVGMLEPGLFASKLSQFIRPFFRHHVYAVLVNSLLWVRLSLFESTSAKPSLPSGKDIIFLVHQPHAPSLLTTSIKPTYKDVLLQALASVFKCVSVEAGQLIGKDVDNLVELLVNPLAQGNMSQYKLNQVDPNPLDRKRKKPVIEEPSRITTDDAAEQARKNKQARLHFGENPLPVLERIDFKLQTTFRHDEIGNISPFHCTVQLEGANVLEGLKALVPKGIVVGAMPELFAQIPRLASATIEITDDV